MKKPIKFGKYYLLERINVGGMAEVFRAKAYGVEGFERLVAVKRILPNIAEDKEFIRMFVDEAKIAVQLNHANIAQIFDLGVEDGAYYISLEHIHGRDLRAIFDRCRNRGEPMPVAQACFVTMKVCEGLDYAHNKRDQGGRELNLVHRDVSPQNIIVSFEGEIKIIDFGIAKAAGKGSKTQAGILKGKFGYMSPEQVRGLPIDRRSDVFSCGIVLYELLTGERLFVGESDFSTLEKVRNVEILPPSTYNRRIPPELERIVLKALSKDVEDRYQNAIDLHDELQAFVYTAGEFYSRKDLAGWMKHTFGPEIEHETSKLEAFRQMAPPEVRPAEGRRADTLSLAGPSKTLPPPIPANRRTQAVGTVPPPAPLLQGARGSQLEWDDDELETSIYDEENKNAELGSTGLPTVPGKEGPMPGAGPRMTDPSAAPPAPKPMPSTVGAGLKGDPDEPDLSTLVSSTGWEGSATVPESGIAQTTGPRVADGSSSAPAPGQAATGTSDPSAVVRLANLAATQASGYETSSGYSSTMLGTTERPGVGWMLGLVAALLLVAGGVVAVVILTGGDESGSSSSASVSDSDDDAADAPAVIAAPGAAADPDTGFDLIVDPAGVAVTLDGRPIGKAPLQIRNLAPGDHTVEIQAPAGFFNKTQTVHVERGSAERVSMKLDAMEITSSFASEPKGARVTLVSDGVRTRLGSTPIEGHRLDPRKRYDVIFEKAGFVTVTKPVPVGGAATVKVEANLERASRSVAEAEPRERPERTTAPVPKREEVAAIADDKPPRQKEPKPAAVESAEMGTLMLNSKPPCRIFIDGRDVGLKTPQREIKLTSGRHRITLVNNELGIKEAFNVKISAGETTTAIKDLTSRIEN